MARNIDDKPSTDRLFAISKAFARSKDGMTITEKKLCCIYLSKLEWKNLNNEREIWVDKSEIMEALGSKIDTTDQSTYLRKLSQNMVHHSEMHFQGADRNEWEDVPIFTNRRSTKGKLMIKLNEDAMPHLENLSCDYITLFLKDILNFPNTVEGQRAYKLYEYLRTNSDTRRKECSTILSTKKIKELFDIPFKGEGSYIRKDGSLDRKNFEKRVIEPVLNILAECSHVVLFDYGRNQKNERVLYEKIKKNGMVEGYEITYCINMTCKKIKPKTIIEMRNNPHIEKIAQDILNGNNKKPAKNTKKGGFTNREYDFSALEQQLIENQ